ncbi:MAG: heparinase II/III family protein [Verrucomicrobia bacterium]|nr:heparinase II/III family protein [Verrucomicrobiota bacterium]
MPPRKGQHPRLLFCADELVRLRREAAVGLKARVLESLRRLCEACMTPGHPHYLDFNERKRDIWRQRAGIFPVLSSLNGLATCYAFTGDRRVGDFARDALMAIIDHGLADVASKAYGVSTTGWRHGPGHDKGKFAQTVCWIYDFCHDRFSARQCARVAAYAKEGMSLALKWYDFDQAQVTNNRGVRGILANVWYCLTFENDALLPDAEGWFLKGLVAMEKYLFLAHDEQGAPYEGPGYAGCLSFIAATAEALRRRGYPDLLTNNRFERLPEYLMYELIPGGGSVNNLNDCHTPCGSVTGSLLLMNSPCGGLLPWLATQLDLHPSRATDWLAGVRSLVHFQHGEHAFFFLLWWKEGLPVRDPLSLGYPLSRCFRTRGVASMRTGWGSDDWLVSHFCGRQELYCHRQGDFNHVSFYALGESFLVDAGYGDKQRDLSKPISDWFKRTTSHNCVVINGSNQRGILAAPGWAEGAMVDFQHGAVFDASLGDASSCSGPDHRMRRALRRVVMVRQGCPYLAIVDVNEIDGKPFTAECLWHTDCRNRIEIAGARFFIHGKVHVCFGQVLWPRNALLRAERDHARPRLRVSTTAAVTEMVAVFCPVQKGKPPPRFSCRRLSEGRFLIECRNEGGVSRLDVSAAVHLPSREPLPVRFEAAGLARTQS